MPLEFTCLFAVLIGDKSLFKFGGGRPEMSIMKCFRDGSLENHSIGRRDVSG